MTPEAIALLQQSIGKVVRITRADGEVITAKIILVDYHDEEIAFDMLSTTDNPNIKSPTGSQPTYCFSATSPAPDAVTNSSS